MSQIHWILYPILAYVHGIVVRFNHLKESWSHSFNKWLSYFFAWLALKKSLFLKYCKLIPVEKYEILFNKVKLFQKQLLSARQKNTNLHTTIDRLTISLSKQVNSYEKLVIKYNALKKKKVVSSNTKEWCETCNPKPLPMLISAPAPPPPCAPKLADLKLNVLPSTITGFIPGQLKHRKIVSKYKPKKAGFSVSLNDIKSTLASLKKSCEPGSKKKYSNSNENSQPKHKGQTTPEFLQKLRKRRKVLADPKTINEEPLPNWHKLTLKKVVKQQKQQNQQSLFKTPQKTPKDCGNLQLSGCTPSKATPGLRSPASLGFGEKTNENTHSPIQNIWKAKLKKTNQMRSPGGTPLVDKKSNFKSQDIQSLNKSKLTYTSAGTRSTMTRSKKTRRFGSKVQHVAVA